MMTHRLFLVVALIAGTSTCSILSGADASGTSAPDPEYAAVVRGRAAKIVTSLGIDDPARAERVTETIARQYQDLRDIHDVRDTSIATTRDALKDDKAELESALSDIHDEAELKQWRLHAAFLARLAAELSPEQIDRVKDGLTYGVVPGTYKHYLELYPALSPEQQRQVYAWLIEAREHAMDGGSSDEKHGWFKKYKGRINNYLSKAGFDAKEAERVWNEKQKGAGGAPRR